MNKDFSSCYKKFIFRLYSLGFMSLGTAHAPGNQGLIDQVIIINTIIIIIIIILRSWRFSLCGTTLKGGKEITNPNL